MRVTPSAPVVVVVVVPGCAPEPPATTRRVTVRVTLVPSSFVELSAIANVCCFFYCFCKLYLYSAFHARQVCLHTLLCVVGCTLLSDRAGQQHTTCQQLGTNGANSRHWSETPTTTIQSINSTQSPDLNYCPTGFLRAGDHSQLWFHGGQETCLGCSVSVGSSCCGMSPQWQRIVLVSTAGHCGEH